MLYRSTAVFCEDYFVANLNRRLQQNTIIGIFTNTYSQNLALLRFFFNSSVRQEDAAGSLFFNFYSLNDNMIS